MYTEMKTLFPPREYMRLIATPLKSSNEQADGRDISNANPIFFETDSCVTVDYRAAIPLVRVSQLTATQVAAAVTAAAGAMIDPAGSSSPYTADGFSAADSPRRAVIAIGPEGGWEDAELELFRAAGFAGVHLGPRILRTDTAVGSPVVPYARPLA